jgi:hypothetical protein
MIDDPVAGKEVIDVFGSAAFADVVKGLVAVSAERAAGIRAAAAAQASDLAILRGIRLSILEPLVLPDHARRVEA